MQKINTNTFSGPSFSKANRLARMIWGMCWLLLFRPSPRPFHGWRRMLLRCFGAQVGHGVHVYPGAKIWAPWNLELGDECSIADGAIIYSQALIQIGRRAVISQGVHLCTGTHDYRDRGMPLITKSIIVGAEAWLTAECFVMPGVNIGDGAVMAARSVVTKDMPAWHVCAGHPCVPLKPRSYR